MIAARQIAFGRGKVASEELPANWWLCFTAEEAGSTIAMSTSGTNPPAVTLETSFDGDVWEPFIVGDTTVTLQSVGDKVYFRAGEGGNLRFAYAVSDFNPIRYNFFVLTGRMAASGSIQSLLDGEKEINYVNTYSFSYLFNGCKSLTSAPMLPAAKLAKHCYMRVFINCSNLSLVKVNWNNFSNATSTSGYTYLWLKNTLPTGTFICPTALGTNETIKRGTSFCPEGWTVINED